MATKPISAFSWATTLNYSSGPASGNPTKISPIGTEGFVSGAEGRPETLNFALNSVGDDWLTGWMLLGSSAAGLDAHVMETDASGFHNGARMILGGTAATSFALTVAENSGASGTTADMSNSSGGIVLDLTADSEQCIRAVTSGGQFAIDASATGGGGGGGVTGTGDGPNPGMRGVGGATGIGVEGVSGATGTTGVKGTSATGDGVQGECTASATAGVRGSGHASNTGTTGVIGITTQFDGLGVAGFNLFAGGDPVNASHSGVFGSATDSTGVYGNSTNGYGLLAQSDTSSPSRSALRIVPQDVDPGTFLNGDVYYDSTLDALKAVSNATWQIAHLSINGFLENHTSASSGSKNGTGFSSFTSANVSPKKVGSVMVHVTGSFRNTSSNLNTVEVQLWDSLAGAEIARTEIFLAQTNATVTVASARPNAFERTIDLRSSYVLPSTSTRAVQVRIATHGVSTGIEFDDLVLNVEGVF